MRKMLLAALVSLSLTVPVGAARSQTTEEITFHLGDRLLCPAEPNRLCNDRSSEPAVKVDVNTGNAWVTAQNGLPAGVNLFRREPGGTFTFVDKTDQVPVVTQRSGVALGGGDSDIAIGSTGNVYTASLWGGGVMFTAYNQDGDVLHQNPLAGGKPNIDRHWLAAYSENTVYMSHWDLASPRREIWVSRSDTGGLLWGPPVSAVRPESRTAATGGFSSIGNLAVDQRTGNVYTLFSSNYPEGNALYIARSDDAGMSFDNVLIWQHDQIAPDPEGPGSRIGGLFPVVAVDLASNLHVTWSDAQDIWYSRSLDGGDTWSAPMRVNDRSVSRTSVFPWITAGSEGRVGIAWIGGQAENTSNASPHLPFYAYYAQTINGTDPEPVFTQVQASDDPVHQAGICLAGLSCQTNMETPSEVPQGPFKKALGLAADVRETGSRYLKGGGPADPVLSDGDNRALLEVVMVTVDVDGYALVGYPDGYERGRQRPTISVVAKQASGPRLYAPGDFPNPAFAP